MRYNRVADEEARRADAAIGERYRMIQLENIGYKVTDGKGKTNVILEGIDLEFPDSSITVITGQNGSGKSTLVKLLSGIESPTSGKIYYDGRDITKLGITERAKLGFTTAFQQPVRFKGITVRKLLDIASDHRNNLAGLCEYLSVVGLCARDYIDRELDDSLSGGELKRIELAMAIAKNGSVFLLDEPEAGIDLWSFDNLTRLFTRLTGKTVLIVSHQSKIIDIADRIVLLDKSGSPKVGTKEEMLPLIHGSRGVCSVIDGESKNNG